MDEATMRDLLLRDYEVRIEKHMAGYAMRQIAAGKVFSVLGGHARTGVPVRRDIDPLLLNPVHQTPTIAL